MQCHSLEGAAGSRDAQWPSSDNSCTTVAAFYLQQTLALGNFHKALAPILLFSCKTGVRPHATQTKPGKIYSLVTRYAQFYMFIRSTQENVFRVLSTKLSDGLRSNCLQPKGKHMAASGVIDHSNIHRLNFSDPRCHL
jgi:hypothetical protein